MLYHFIQAIEPRSAILTERSTNFTYTDPQTFEGEPQEAAAKAAEQAGRTAALTHRATEAAEVLARNAWMSRNLRAGESPDAAGWEASQEGQRWAVILRLLAQLPGRLTELSELAGQKDHQ